MFRISHSKVSALLQVSAALLFLAALLPPGGLQAGEPDGDQLLGDMIRIINPEKSHAVMKQIIVTSSGDSRELSYETWSLGSGEMSLMRYLEPSRVRGNALLMKDFSNRIWMYNKRSGRTRLLASSARKQKFEGSDFSYEDMGSGDSWKNDYSAKALGIEPFRGSDCYLLELSARPGSDLSYSRLLCRLRVADSVPLQIDYFDRENKRLKILHLEDIRSIQGIPTPMIMRMENLQDRTETAMHYIEVDYGVELDASFFNERNLGR